MRHQIFSLEKLEVAYNDNNYQIKGSTDTDPKNDIGGYELYPLEGMGHMGPTRIEFRRGQREIVGVLIGISIPVLLVLFALLAIITNHFRCQSIEKTNKYSQLS